MAHPVKNYNSPDDPFYRFGRLLNRALWTSRYFSFAKANIFLLSKTRIELVQNGPFCAAAPGKLSDRWL